MRLSRSVRSLVPALVPAALGLLAWLLDRPDRALVLWALASVCLLLVLAGVPLARYVVSTGRFVAHCIGVLGTGAIGLALIGAGAVARIGGSDPLSPGGSRRSGWQSAAPSSVADRLSASQFGPEPGRGAGDLSGGVVRGVLRGTVAVIGTVTLILAVDLGIGLGWEAVKGDTGRVGQVVDAINLSGNRTTVHDVRADLPAMAAYPWADAYFRETQLTPSSYWPFTESRPLPFHGRYINIDGWSRRSYEPSDLPADAPVVWMFGGSTTWGEGQRDDYTIASYLSRIATDAGAPIRVVNYGQRGWTHFQEMILFEQLLAAGPGPDLALFYDGANEINAQTLGAKGVPTHTLADQYAQRLSGGSISQEFGERGAAEPGALSTIWSTYARHSAVRKVVGRIYDAVSPPAGAAPADRAPRAGEDQPPGTTYVKTVEDARNAVEVYERGRRITQHLAADRSVDAVFFWQPVVIGPAEEWANAHISAPTVNISDALIDHQDVFIDGGHTNEEGARLVALRIWDEIGGRIRSLSEDHSAGASGARTDPAAQPDAATSATGPRG